MPDDGALAFVLYGDSHAAQYHDAATERFGSGALVSDPGCLSAGGLSNQYPDDPETMACRGLDTRVQDLVRQREVRTIIWAQRWERTLYPPDSTTSLGATDGEGGPHLLAAMERFADSLPAGVRIIIMGNSPTAWAAGPLMEGGWMRCRAWRKRGLPGQLPRRPRRRPQDQCHAAELCRTRSALCLCRCAGAAMSRGALPADSGRPAQLLGRQPHDHRRCTPGDGHNTEGRGATLKPADAARWPSCLDRPPSLPLRPNLPTGVDDGPPLFPPSMTLCWSRDAQIIASVRDRAMLRPEIRCELGRGCRPSAVRLLWDWWSDQSWRSMWCHFDAFEAVKAKADVIAFSHSGWRSRRSAREAQLHLSGHDQFTNVARHHPCRCSFARADRHFCWTDIETRCSPRSTPARW